MTLLFVYGTLKRGFASNYKLDGHPQSKYVGDAITFDNTFNLISNEAEQFPFAFNGHHKISGEVYEATPLKLKILDSFEGVPYLYYRPEIQVIDRVSGEVHWAFIYLGTASARMNHCMKYASTAVAYDPVTNLVSWRGKVK